MAVVWCTVLSAESRFAAFCKEEMACSQATSTSACLSHEESKRKAHFTKDVSERDFDAFTKCELRFRCLLYSAQYRVK